MLIKNAYLILSKEVKKLDILIESNKITRIGENISEKCKEQIDARGKYIFPGFIDMHTHLRTPGREDEEDLLSGSKAAAKGGFTKIFCMPNTQPPIDNQGLAKWILEEGKKIAIVDIYPVGAITVNRAGKQLTEFEALSGAGCFSLSDDGDSVSDSLILRRALEYAKMTKMLIISHCEDTSLSNKGVIRESFISSKYGLPAVSDISESLIVNRDIELAKYLDARIHLAHISSFKSIEIIKRAKKEGVKVTAETCPHYFCLTVEDIEKGNFNSNFKVNPPLGEKKDLKAIRQALKDGVIDCIATDHAPHSLAEKEVPFEGAPFGLIGLEFAFSLAYTYLVKGNIIGLPAIAEKMSLNPAKIIGLKNCGEIKEGNFADLAIVDLEKTQKIDKESIFSKSKNTPFLGKELEGVVECTIHNGRIVYQKDKNI